MSTLQARAAMETMPYGPYRGVPLDMVDVEHLAELIAEPEVVLVDETGKPRRLAPDELSPFGGAMGKIRRCSCFPVVRDLVDAAKPEPAAPPPTGSGPPRTKRRK